MVTLKIAICDDDLLFGNQAQNEVKKLYVFSAFDVSASHYLLKPFDLLKLEQVLIKITTELNMEKEYCCTIKCGNEIHSISFSKIKFLRKEGDV